MNFKNDLEKHAFDVAQNVCDGTVSIDHNKVLQIESALYPEVAAFSGPPKKEVDLITAELSTKPKIDLLVSCKHFQASKAEPAHIQEWGAVVHTMNKYSNQTTYLGIVISPSGFTRGCEPWATSHNIGLIPPLKGKNIAFSYDTSLTMLERILKALVKRLAFPHDELFSAPSFYEFVYRLVAGFEGYEEKAKDGKRYVLTGNGWLSSFGELVSMLMRKKIIEIVSSPEYPALKFAEGQVFRFYGTKIVFGNDDNIVAQHIDPVCQKNLSHSDCLFELSVTKIEHTK